MGFEQAQESVREFQIALLDGYPAPGEPKPHGVPHGAVREAAIRLKIDDHTLRYRLKVAEQCFGLVPNMGVFMPKDGTKAVSATTLADGLASAAQTPLNREIEASIPIGEVERLTDLVKSLQKDLRLARKDEAESAVIRQTIFGLADEMPAPPDWVVDVKPASGTPGVPVVFWSDWHWGEVIRPEEVAGVNQFNLENAHRRVRTLVERIIDLCFNHMVNPSYPGIVVPIGGDMLSGEIHAELAESNELQTAPALMDLYGVLVWAITELASRFGKVFVPCVVGNHGRMTMKIRAKGRVHTSFEWVLFQMLEKHFAGDKRVKFLIPGETDASFTVAGHRYLLTHGDSMGVKGGDGIIGMLGPVARGTVKMRVSEAQIGRDFDTVLMGHWHQTLWLPGCVVNGSLKGYDEFARLFLRARYQAPQQSLWFVHPKLGPTFHVPIFVDEARSVESPWLQWRQ